MPPFPPTVLAEINAAAEEEAAAAANAHGPGAAAPELLRDPWSFAAIPGASNVAF